MCKEHKRADHVERVDSEERTQSTKRADREECAQSPTRADRVECARETKVSLVVKRLRKAKSM